MRLKFTPTDSMKAYHGDCPDGSSAHCPHEGIYDVPDDKAEQLLADFPLNFKRASGLGGEKMEPGPLHNRMEIAPTDNRVEPKRSRKG